MPVRLEIHPAIGVARVGTSNSHFIFAGPASDNAPRRDPSGLIRQAVAFRVYRCDRDNSGRLTHAEEVTSASASIQWSVHVANRKAAAMRFGGGGRRNNATGNDATDRALIIDAGVQTVSNPNESKSLDGKFGTRPVNLGRITVAANGRLLFVGSDGGAASPSSKPIVDFADNDGWFDAISDGVVRAKVTPQGGQASDALAAWVIVAPPDYAPGITNIVTMFDVLTDLAIKRGVLPVPQPIVFTRHVRPILERAMRYQWVNRAARLGFEETESGGHSAGGAGDFAQNMEALGNPAAPNAPRTFIFNHLRNPASASSANQKRMPRLNDDQNSGDVFPLTPTTYEASRLWSLGQFVHDAPAETEHEPDALTRMDLEACAGGPFFPGIEAGRIMQDRSKYMDNEAFRLSPDHVKPGEITQNNAVPWQADYHQCRWEEEFQPGQPKRLGWWPAQRPDDVLIDENADPIPWGRGVREEGEGWVDDWHHLGFVKEVTPEFFLERERDEKFPDVPVA